MTCGQRLFFGNVDASVTGFLPDSTNAVRVWESAKIQKTFFKTLFFFFFFNRLYV